MERAYIDGEDDEAQRLEKELERLTARIEGIRTAVKETNMPQQEFKKLLGSYVQTDDLPKLESDDGAVEV